MSGDRVTAVNLVDLVDLDDPQGRTYRQINASITHGLKVGQFVDLENGARAFIVKCGRDCDLTPLYWVSINADDEPHKWDGGYPQDSLVPL